MTQDTGPGYQVAYQVFQPAGALIPLLPTDYRIVRMRSPCTTYTPTSTEESHHLYQQREAISMVHYRQTPEREMVIWVRCILESCARKFQGGWTEITRSISHLKAKLRAKKDNEIRVGAQTPRRPFFPLSWPPEQIQLLVENHRIIF